MTPTKKEVIQMIEIKMDKEDDEQEKKKDIASELHELNKTLKEILREMRKRKI